MTRFVNVVTALIVLIALAPDNAAGKSLSELNARVNGSNVIVSGTYDAPGRTCPISRLDRSGAVLRWIIEHEDCDRDRRTVRLKDERFIRFGRVTTLQVHVPGRTDPLVEQPFQASGLTFVHFASLGLVVTFVIAMVFRWFFK